MLPLTSGVHHRTQSHLQELANANAAELGMQTVPSLNIAYTQEKGYVTADVAKSENLTLLSLSGTKFRKMLR